MTAAKSNKNGGAVKVANVNRRRFVVLWTADQQDRRSAPMTEEEAARFHERLQKEKVASLRIEEEARPALRGTGR